MKIGTRLATLEERIARKELDYHVKCAEQYATYAKQYACRTLADKPTLHATWHEKQAAHIRAHIERKFA